jgi:beta-lactamase regulating signal transducer with metallopeptidase domain
MLAAPLFTLAFYAETGAVTGRLLLALRLASTQEHSAPLQASLWAQRILLAWCAGVIVFAARLIVGWRLSWRLVRSAEEILSPAVGAIFDSVRKQLGIRGPIRLRAHVRLDSPIVVGWLRPVVLLPISLISGFTPEQLSAILAHELAHIRRHDFVVNILQRCVESILFYHPAVWWLSKRIRTEREHCCDDIAIRVCGSRRVYAEALIAMERARQPRPILAVAAADGVVLQRFRRVLGMSSSVVDWQSAVGTLVFLGVWVIVGMWQSAGTLEAVPGSAVKPAVATAAILPAAPAPAAVTESVTAIAAILTAQPVEPARAPQAAPPDTAKGAIQGVVTRAGTSEPIPGAHVAIANAPFDPDALATLLKFWAARGVTMDPQQPGEPDEKYFQTLMDKIAARGLSASLPENQMALELFRAMNTARYSAMADANGRFTIRDVVPGRYTLEAEQQGFFDVPGRQAAATVDAGAPASVVVPLLAGATITGRVNNTAGRLLPNANVTAYQITYLNGKIIPQAQSSQTTDDRGEYRMFWLPPGDYVVVVDPPSYPLSNPLSNTGNAPAIAGPRGGAPPQGPMSTPQFMRTFYPRSLTTQDAGILTVKSGDQLSGMDITVQRGATYRISGDIHAAPYTGTAPPPGRGRGRGRGANADPNTPQRIQGYLGLEYRDPSVIDMRSTNLGGTVPSAGTFFLTSSGDGLRATFEVRDVLPGEYYLVPRVTQAVPTGSGNFGINRIPVDVRDSDVTGLAIELVPSVAVNGTLTIDGRAPGNVTVRVALGAVGNPSPTYQGIPARAVIPNPDDGTFTIANIPQTRYRVEMGAGLPPYLYVSDVRLGPIGVFDTGFEVGREPLAPLQVSLQSGAGSVEGVVRDRSNRPVPNATVVVVPPDARRENRALYKTATSDASGKFTVVGVAPGGYKLFAFEGLAGGEFYNSRFLLKYEFRGTPINVAQGGTTTESLTVIESN